MFALLWCDVLVDPRLQQMSPALFRFWVNLLLVARQHNRDGELPPLDDIVYALRSTAETATRALKLLSQLELVEQAERGSGGSFATGDAGLRYRMHNFAARQDPALLGQSRARTAQARNASRNHRAIVAQRNIINEITSTLTSQVNDETNGEVSDDVVVRDGRATEHAPTEHAPSNRAATRRAPADTRGRFEDWYAVYPRKQDRKRALEAWLKLAPDPFLAEVILRATLKQVAAGLFASGYWPYPTTYLNGERWNDEPVPPAREVRHAGARRGAGATQGPAAPTDSWGDDEPAP